MLQRGFEWATLVLITGLVCARPSRADNRVSHVDVEQSGPRRTVRIATATAPVFATYVLAESRQVMVDIAGADLAHVFGPLPIHDGVLGDVTFRQLEAGPMSMGRITVDLAVHCSTRVSGDGNAIIIEVCPGAADITGDSVLLATTGEQGMQAFVTLAENAASFAAQGPELAQVSELIDDTPAVPDVDGPDSLNDTDDFTVALAQQPPVVTQSPNRDAASVARHRVERAARPLAARQRAVRAAIITARRDAAAGYQARQVPAGAAVAYDLEPMVIEGRRPTAIGGIEALGADGAAASPAVNRTTVVAHRAHGRVIYNGDDDGIVITGRRFVSAQTPLESPETVNGPIVIHGRRPAALAAAAAAQASLTGVQRLDRHRILLRVRGAGRFKSRHLADPPRFVVDLSGIRRDTAEKFFALDADQHASRVRLGDQDFGVRAVFDLRDHHTQARVRRTKDGLLVAFSGRKPPQASVDLPPAPKNKASDGPRLAQPVLPPSAKSG